MKPLLFIFSFIALIVLALYLGHFPLLTDIWYADGSFFYAMVVSAFSSAYILFVFIVIVVLLLFSTQSSSKH